jgi:UDP-N-acetylglucosamine 1-carboxyvinyltransferase
MDQFRITGGTPLKGSVNIRGAKNSTLPLMAGALMVEEPCVLHNVPCLHDVFAMDKVISSMGMGVDFTGQSMRLDPTNVKSTEADYDLVRKLRASFFVLGPLLGRFSKARVSLPGGCAIGSRPVDIHLKGLEALGVEIRIEEGYVVAEGTLKGAKVALDFPSVGATENIMMAACRAEGSTRLSGAAREPEIIDLANFLNKCGAKISGAGDDVIEIEGVDGLGGTDHDVIADRIEAGTFLIAGIATGGDVTAEQCNPDHLPNFLEKLEEMGADIERGENSIRARGNGRVIASDFSTQPYPGYPTDLQAQLMTLMCVADGTSTIKESVFENRFMQAAELSRMGADIDIDGRTAVIRGVEKLSGARVMASDLRASASLVIAGLMVPEGETLISRVYHIDRGYERIEERFSSLGGVIRREREQ